MKRAISAANPSESFISPKVEHKLHVHPLVLHAAVRVGHVRRHQTAPPIDIEIRQRTQIKPKSGTDTGQGVHIADIALRRPRVAYIRERAELHIREARARAPQRYRCQEL